MNRIHFDQINEYLAQGQITITTYRMFIETFETIHKLKKERQALEQHIEDELERMQQGEFNHYYFKNAHFE
jgi:hypothetical protein